MTTCLGIDPGQNGGIAVLGYEGRSNYMAQKMPATERDIWGMIAPLNTGDSFAYIEKLGGMPRDEQGKARQSPTTMFKMGLNNGLLRMALIASGIPFDEVLPRKWQAEFGLLRRPHESQTAKKNRHKAKAQQLFPTLKVTHATADALLIATYCKHQRD